VISFSFVILVTRGKGFFVSPTDADIGDVRAHAVEIHPGVTKIVVMALGATGRWALGAIGRWALGCQRKENGWRGERREKTYFMLIILSGSLQCFPMHWEILLKPND
jgi:hypothetical protein